MNPIANFSDLARASFLLLITTHVSSLCAQYDSSEEKKLLLLQLARENAPDALEILQNSASQEDFTFWVEGSSRDDVLEAFDTVVHETCHSYNIKRSNFRSHSYFIGDTISINVPIGPLFNSHELNSLVPKKLQKRIFRYKTYVGGDDEEISSQTKGIYGLLEEFCAYYHGAKAGLELYGDYKSRCSFQEADCWVKGYLQNLLSSMSSFYEFRLFLTWYLHYAQNNRPDVFDACMSNQALRVAFTLLHDSFQQLHEDFIRLTNEIIQQLNAAGKKVEIIGNSIRIHHRFGYSQYGGAYGKKDFDLLESEFERYDEGMLNKFRIAAVTLENHQEFIKK